MNFWLLKTEPEEWSWQQQVKSGNKGAEWNGVRNFQAAKNLKNMKIGDKCFFYHTGMEKKIVGIAEITKEHFLDKTDKSERFVAVQVKYKSVLKKYKNLCHYKFRSGLIKIKPAQVATGISGREKSSSLICGKSQRAGTSLRQPSSVQENP